MQKNAKFSVENIRKATLFSSKNCKIIGLFLYWHYIFFYYNLHCNLLIIKRMARQSKLSIVRAQLQQKNLTENQINFVLNLYKKIRRNSDPASHHVWCDEISQPMNISVEEVQELVGFFKGWPYRFTATNGREDCAGFRCTDYFVDWLHDIGVK